MSSLISLRAMRYAPSQVWWRTAGRLGMDPMDNVERRAAELVAQAQFNADCNRVADAGKAAYPDFEAALSNLRALGSLTDQNLQLIVETGTEEGARLLYELGADPAEAEKLLTLPPSRFAIELGKRTVAKPAKAAAVVSSAPPPPVKPPSAEPRDDMDDADYFAARVGVATRLVGKGHAWKDEPVVGSSYPKMIYPNGNTHKDGVIVNSREEEEPALTPVAETSARRRAR